MVHYLTPTVINIIKKKQIPQFGLPSEIQTHGASYFASNIIQEFGGQKGIQFSVSSPYHPVSNGMVERYFQIVKNMLIAS